YVCSSDQIPINSCALFVKKLGNSGPFIPASCKSIVPNIGPSSTAVGNLIFTNKYIKISATAINKKIDGNKLTSEVLANSTELVTCPPPWKKGKSTSIVIETIISISRVICVIVTTAKLMPFVSSARISTCDRPPGMLANKDVLKLLSDTFEMNNAMTAHSRSKVTVMKNI